MGKIDEVERQLGLMSKVQNTMEVNLKAGSN